MQLAMPEAMGTPSEIASVLERCYSRHIGRPLRKNEPRYRFQPRPCNLGKFVAIVCLDALEKPMEFVGDPYSQKQFAKHSAALQAIMYLGVQEGELGRAAADTIDTEPSGQSSGPQPHPPTDSGNARQCRRVGSLAPSPEVPRAASGSETSDMPTEDALLTVLRQARQPLPVREVYLVSLGKDPKREKTGPGVAGGVKKRLRDLERAGLASSCHGMWSIRNA